MLPVLFEELTGTRDALAEPVAPQSRAMAKHSPRGILSVAPNASRRALFWHARCVPNVAALHTWWYMLPNQRQQPIPILYGEFATLKLDRQAMLRGECWFARGAVSGGECCPVTEDECVGRDLIEASVAAR